MEIFKRLVFILSLLIISNVVVSTETEELNQNTRFRRRGENANDAHEIYQSQPYTKGANPSKDHFKIKQLYNKRPNSNIEEPEHIDSIRSRRDAQKPDQKIAAIRKKLEEEKRKEQMMNDPRLDPNHTVIPSINNSVDPRYGGINTEQTNNHAHDKLHQLLSTHKKETSNYVAPKIECDFESLCTWKWGTSPEAGFKVTTAGNKAENETGPPSDADSEYTGKIIQFTCIKGCLLVKTNKICTTLSMLQIIVCISVYFYALKMLMRTS